MWTCTCMAGPGADFMDGTVEAVQRSCAAHLRHGTTTIFPTTTTAGSEQLQEMISACRALLSSSSGIGGRPQLRGCTFTDRILRQTSPAVMTVSRAEFRRRLNLNSTFNLVWSGLPRVQRSCRGRWISIVRLAGVAVWSPVVIRMPAGRRCVRHFGRGCGTWIIFGVP